MPGGVRAAVLDHEQVIDARGVEVTQELLDEIVERTRTGGAIDRELRFGGAVFISRVELKQVRLERPVSFSHATFRDRVMFSGVTFAAMTRFDHARFESTSERVIAGERSAPTRFLDCVFGGRTRFDHACFKGRTSFARSVFSHHMRLDGARFDGDARFDRTTFERARSTGWFSVGGYCRFDFATFERFVALYVSAKLLNLGSTQFRGGVNLEVGRGDIVIEQCELAGASSISVPRPAGLTVDDKGPGLEPEVDVGPEAPRLVSLRGTSISRLTVSGVDMRPCLFEGTHGLGGLRLGSTAQLGQPPDTGSLWPPRRWIRRDVIADERRWRVDVARWPEWELAPEYDVSMELKGVRTLSAAEVSDIYRGLRRGREEGGDEPGAADFYYGEMEMRRRAHLDRERGEPVRGIQARWLLAAYWAISGYALRPRRAAVGLLAVIGLFSLLVWQIGVREQTTFWDALLATTEAATLRGSKHVHFSSAGFWLELPLRLLGPLFFGLILVSLRGRVKR